LMCDAEPHGRDIMPGFMLATLGMVAAQQRWQQHSSSGSTAAMAAAQQQWQHSSGGSSTAVAAYLVAVEGCVPLQIPDGDVGDVGSIDARREELHFPVRRCRGSRHDSGDKGHAGAATTW
jgi:hypothetical protein